MVLADTTRTAATGRYARGGVVVVAPVPSSLVASADIDSVTLTWAFLFTPDVFSHFDIKRDGVEIGESSITSFVDDTAVDGVTYEYTVEYEGESSNAATGGWVSTPLAGIEIVSITNATAGTTIAVNAVADTTNYQYERSTDPLTGFVEIAEQAGTSYQDTTGTAGVIYFYRVRADDGTPSVSRVGTKLAAVAADAIVPSAAVFTATHRSIGVEIPHTGDTNRSARAHIEFRETDGEWRHCLPMRSWAAYYDSGTSIVARGITGSVLDLDPDTEYEVRVTLTDTAGVDGTVVHLATVRTSAIPTLAASLSPTHFITTSGSDSANGAEGTPWLTINKAISTANAAIAGTEIVAEVGPGSFELPTTTYAPTAAGVKLTIIAANLAVDTDAAAQNAGTRTVIETKERALHSAFSKPAGDVAAGGTSAPWESVAANGVVNTGSTYQVWRWTAALGAQPWRMLLKTHRSDNASAEPPLHIFNWTTKTTLDQRGYRIDTPAGWAEVLRINTSYNYGFASFLNGANYDVYVRLPGDLDPNDYYIHINADKPSASNGNKRWHVNGPDFRLCGVELHHTLHASVNADRLVVDRNLFYDGQVYFSGTSGTTSDYSYDHYIGYNRMVTTGIWDSGVAWRGIKQKITIGTGSAGQPSQGGIETPWQRTLEQAERTAIVIPGARQTTIEHNQIIGYFNGVAGFTDDYDHNAKRDTDIYTNHFENWGDDAIEPDGRGGGSINWRVWGNTFHDGVICVSAAPLKCGPLYFFRNQVWNTNNSTYPLDGTGDAGVEPNVIKYSGSVLTGHAGWVYWIHNTVWSDASTPTLSRFSVEGDPGGADHTKFYIVNNITRLQRKALDFEGQAAADFYEDYNHFAVVADGSVSADVIRIPGGGSYANVADYRAATAWGDHTNTYADFTNEAALDAELTDPDNGDLTLAGTNLRNIGVPVPNISDTYTGAAPALGAVEA